MQSTKEPKFKVGDTAYYTRINVVQRFVSKDLYRITGVSINETRGTYEYQARSVEFPNFDICTFSEHELYIK